MTVKEKTKPTQQTTPTSLGQWLMVGAILAAVALLAIRAVDLMGDEEVAPAVPATEVGTEWTLENQWIAQVKVTKNADLIEFYRAPFMASVAKIQEQRAADMVEHFSKQYQGTVPMRQGGGGIIFTF